MKIFPDLILLGSVVGVLATATVLYWSNRQVGSLTAAEAAFAQARATHRDALGESTARLGQLSARLVEAQRSDRVPPTYEEWSRQQAEARAAVAGLRQRLADLEPSPTSAIAPRPRLVAAAQEVRGLSTRLVATWREFEQRGSGLTPPSRDLAVTQLLPLLADELPPAIAELSAAEMADADFKAAAFPRLVTPIRRLRLAAAAALLVALAALGYALRRGRRAAPHLLVKAQEKLTAARPREVATIPAAETTTPVPGQLRVLVAGPNAADRDTLSLLLTNAGYAVTGCDHDDAARAALKNLPVALVLIDLNFPPKGGAEMLAEARRRHPRLPAILLCDPHDDVRHLETRAPAATEIVRRPFNPRTLLWTVSEILYPGENRESREYSPYVPEPDDDMSPAEAPAPATPLAEPAPGGPPRRFRPLARAAAAASPLAAEPAAAPAPSSAPAEPFPPPADVRASGEPPPAPALRPLFTAPPPPAPAPETSAPAASAPEPAPSLSASSAPAEPSSPSSSPGFPRKKMVRRRILPPE